MIVYGKNTVMELLKQNRKINKLYLAKDFTDNNILNLLKSKNIEIISWPYAKMNQTFNGNHQGIAADIEDYKYCILEEMIKKNEKNDSVLVILDGLEDPHNLGAILRSADATGMNGIIIPKNRSVSLNETVAKVSTGAIEHIDVAQVTNLVSSIKMLKEHGYWIIGLELDGSIDYRKQDYSGKIALIIGSEGKGISRLVKEECDFLVNIPMRGHVNSLNASVSAAILFYEVLRNRGL